MNTDLTKTVLYVYPMMKKLAEATRVGARNKALLSYRSQCDAMHDLEAVAEDMLLARRLDELKELLESLFARLDREELFLLEYRYFRRKRVLARFDQMLACSERNYFRKQERLLKKLSSWLLSRGVTEEYFLAAFRGSVCLRKVYRAVQNGGELKICARREKRGVRFQGSSFSGGAGFLPRATNTEITSTATAASVIKTIWTADRLSELFPPAVGTSGSGR